MTKKVIIIDDSSTSLNLIKTAFARNLWTVYSASGAKSAYDLIFDVAPDLIVADAIMPVMGGFQLVKAIKQNELISEIPIIIYSNLTENNAKFYNKESKCEYFLHKKDNMDDLIELAFKACNDHPVSDEYKANILAAKPTVSNIENMINIQEKQEYKETEQPQIEIEQEIQEKIESQTEEKKEVVDSEKLAQNFKENYNFLYSDDKILSEIFSLLYKALSYDLCVVGVYSFEKRQNIVYFDIRNIILSPIFQSAMAKKYDSKETVLFKKYSPSLKTIVNEEEFGSNIEFSFEYKEKNIANVVFYAKEKLKWNNDFELIENIRTILENFFRARYVNKRSQIDKKDNPALQYLSNKFDFSFFNKSENVEKKDIYFCVLELANISEIKENMSEYDVDIINSKISEKIITSLDKDEKIFENNSEEYIILINTLDEKAVLYKMNYLLNALKTVDASLEKLDVVVGISKSSSEDFDVQEARKIAQSALDETNEDKKIVVKNAK